MSGRIPVYNINNAFGGLASTTIFLDLLNSSNESIGGYVTHEIIGNGEISSLSGQVIIHNVQPGTYTVSANLYKGTSSDDIATGTYYTLSNGNLIIQVFPN